MPHYQVVRSIHIDAPLCQVNEFYSDDLSVTPREKLVTEIYMPLHSSGSKR
jgi:hypothetical protein